MYHSGVVSKVVKRAYRYRFYPTGEQRAQLARTFGCVRYVYNRALAECSRAWSQEQHRVNYAQTSKMLTDWKRDLDTVWLAEPSKGPLPEGTQPSQVTVSKDSAGRYHISILVESRIDEHEPVDTTVGLDAGIICTSSPLDWCAKTK